MRDNVEVLANLLVAILAIGVSFAGVAMLVGSWFAIARRGRTDNIRTRAWRSLWPKIRQAGLWHEAALLHQRIVSLEAEIERMTE